MPLDISIRTDSDGLRALAEWMRRQADSLDTTAGDVYRVRGESETVWEGRASEGFRGVMTKTGKGIDQVGEQLSGSHRAVSDFADQIDTSKARMNQAREVAAAGGLATTETAIAEPGPPPAAPPTLPTDVPPTPQQQDAHAAATRAQDAHHAQIKAYNEAAQIVRHARGTESAAQSTLRRFLSGQLQQSPFTIANLGADLVAERIKKTSKYRAKAQGYSDRAARAKKLMHSKNLGLRNQTRAARINIRNQQWADKYGKIAKGGKIAQGIDKLPEQGKSILTGTFGNSIHGGGALKRTAGAVLKRVPYVGSAITAFGIGSSIANGKDPTKAVASGVSSWAAGAAVGAAIGGPVGVVAGAVVGAGVGFVVDEWGDEIAGAAGDAVEGVKDFFGGIF